MTQLDIACGLIKSKSGLLVARRRSDGAVPFNKYIGRVEERTKVGCEYQPKLNQSS